MSYNKEILKLKEKRAGVWNKAKAMLDKYGSDTMSGEDLVTYENMETEIDTLGRQISAMERQAEIEKQMNAASSTPIINNPRVAPEDDGKTGRASAAYKNAFWRNVRNKNVPYEVTNALSVGTDSEGGYLVPDEFEHTLVQALEEQNFMRSVATTITTTSGDRKIPVVTSHGDAEWTEEKGKIPESDDNFDQITLGAYKLATTIKVSEELVADSAFDIEAYLAAEFARRFGAKEEEAFLVGNGTGKPTGIFTTAESGATAKAADVLTFDDIFDLYYSLRSPYRAKGIWICNDSTVKALRKIKDSEGQYLWQPSVSLATPDMILNRPIRTSGYAPEIAGDAAPIAFGDPSYYWIADRQGRVFKRLNELYAENDLVGFKATQRVDGKLTLGEAFKTLKMASA